MDDFIDIGQIDEDLVLDDDISSFELSIYDIKDLPNFRYPAILVSGVKFNDTLRVLQTAYRESFRLFDVWLDLEDGNSPIKQGSLPADSTTFLIMRYLGLRVTLYLNEDNIEVLDLNDPEVISKFI